MTLRSSTTPTRGRAVNVDRRHLSETQRAMVAARLASMSVGRPGGNRPKLGDNSSAQAAKMFGVGMVVSKDVASVGLCNEGEMDN